MSLHTYISSVSDLMSIMEVRCPRCGSPCSSRGDMINEYVCSRCGAAFRFIDTGRIVIPGTVIQNCPACGRPIKVEEGYMCIECGKQSICPNCIQDVSGKFVCRNCLNNKGFIVGPSFTCPKCNKQLAYVSQTNKWYCSNCKTYASHICQKCGRPATYNPKYYKWYCDNCKTYLKRFCPNCKGEVTYNLLKKGWY